MNSRIHMGEVNSLEDHQFEWIFSNVIELCTEAAAQVRKRRPFDSLYDLSNAFNNYLDNLSQEGKINILKLHPDLAGALAVRGELSRESTGEQRSAGLDKLTEDQKTTITSLNEQYDMICSILIACKIPLLGKASCSGYKAKFGFPFLICARENKVQSIIEGLQSRYNNTKQQEVINGINEVKKICKLRLQDIIKDD